MTGLATSWAPHDKLTWVARLVSRGSMGSNRWNIFINAAGILLLVSLLGYVGVQLFSGITVSGMRGVDTFTYWKYANALVHGQKISETSRVVLYLLDAAALKLIGVNDYSIRALIAVAALFNIILVFFVALKLSGNSIIAVCAAAVYSLNPMTLYYSRLELPHVFAALGVLSISLFSLAALNYNKSRRARLAQVFAVGFFSAATCLIHEDLVFVGICFDALVVFLFARGGEQSGEGRLRETLIVACVLAFGGIFGVAVPLLISGVEPNRVVADFLATHNALEANTLVRTGGAVLRGVARKVFNNLIFDLLGLYLACTVALGLIVVPVMFVTKRSERLLRLLAIEVVVAGYFTAFVALVHVYLEGSYARIFIPIFALIAPFTVCALYTVCELLLKAMGIRAWQGAFAATAILACCYGPLVAHDYRSEIIRRGPSYDRELYDAAKGIVGSHARLLLPACYELPARWVGVGSDVYLGQKVVPLFLARNLSGFSDFLERHSIRYVYVPDRFERGLSSLKRVRKIFVKFYGVRFDKQIRADFELAPQNIYPGDKRVEWTRAACMTEKTLLLRDVKAEGGVPVAEVDSAGRIYRVNVRASNGAHGD